MSGDNDSLTRSEGGIEIYWDTNDDERLLHSQQLVSRWVPVRSFQFRGVWQSFGRVTDPESGRLLARCRR